MSWWVWFLFGSAFGAVVGVIATGILAAGRIELPDGDEDLGSE